jgi:predicted dehydrogenase
MWIDSVSWHQGAHAVDLVYWLLNEPLTCVGAAVGYHASHDQSTDVSATLVTPTATLVTITISYNATHKVFDCVLVSEKSLLELQDFTTLRLDGVELVREIDPFDSLEQAYRRYGLELVAGLREGGPVPVEAVELLPVMEQLDRMHALAAGQLSR